MAFTESDQTPLERQNRAVDPVSRRGYGTDDSSVVDKLLFGDLDDDVDMPEPELDVDKAWHGVQVLLTGTQWGFGPAQRRRSSAESRSATTVATGPPDSCIRRSSRRSRRGCASTIDGVEVVGSICRPAALITRSRQAATPPASAALCRRPEEDVRRNDNKHSCGQDETHDRMRTEERGRRPH